MTYDFRLPDIGEGISEASLIEWLVAVGDQVEEGDDVAVISTDKADVEIASPRRGTVEELCWKTGDMINVGQVLMKFRGAGPDDITAPPAPETVAVGTPPTAAQVIAAPATRKLAAETGVDLETIAGSGPDGAITRADVESAQNATAPAEANGRIETLDPLRQAMAARLEQSVRNSVHSTIDFQVDGSALASLRQRLSAAEGLSDARMSLTAIIAKCVAAALGRHPRLNATIDQAGQQLHFHRHVDLGIALASPRGLVVPVLRDVGGKPGVQIAAELNLLTERGREGKLTPVEMRSGSFTLSNTGNLEQAMIEYTTPIIVPPQTAILWVSRLRDRLWIEDGCAIVRPVLNASLSFDHRCHDGADAMSFINDISRFVQTPEAALAT